MNIQNPTLLTSLRAGLALLLLALALAATTGRAQTATPPQLMSYQGYLTDANGTPLGATNTGPKNYNVVFRVWDLQTGGTTNGSDELYAEQQTVTVNNGYFSVLLGQGTPYNTEPHTNSLAALFYSTNTNPRYVEITVLGIGVSGANITILPRLQLLSSPYAFLAANAVNASTATTLINNNNSTQVVTVTNGAVGIGTTSPSAELSLGNSQAYDKLALYDDGLASDTYGLGFVGGQFRFNLGNPSGRFSFLQTPSSSIDLLTILGTGNVGIGTSTPVAKLEVAGNMQVDANGLFAGSVGVGQVNTGFYGDGGNIALRTYPNAAIFFQTSGGAQTRMYIANSGNVGINTTSPDRVLSVNGSADFVNYATVNGSANPGIGVVSTATGGGEFDAGVATGAGSWSTSAAVGDVVLRNMGGKLFLQSGPYAPAIAITTANLVGIGTTTPAAGLDVEVTGQISGKTWSYAQAGVPFNTSQYGGSPNIDVYTSGAMGASTYYAFSDARIKNIAGVSSSARDLNTLRGIQVTDFTYKDVVAKGAGPVKKVIAQQVEKVYPQAVSQGKGVVPDIYHLAPVKNGWVQLATNLKAGERVRLLQENNSTSYEVLATTNGAFRVDLPPAVEQVFVYGREVDDFRTVDYEAIAMLNVSATQELAKRLDQVEAREARLADLERKGAQVDDLEGQVAELKKLVTQLAESAKNSKLTADTLSKSVTTASLDR